MPEINLGFISFTVWPVLLIISVVIGAIVTLLSAKKHKKNAGGALLVFLLAGLVVGRIVYAIRDFESFSGVAALFDISDGRIDYTAAFIASLIVLVVQQRNKEKRKALNNGAFTMLGIYAGFSFLIAVASSHAVLPSSDFIRIDGSTVKLQSIIQQRPVVVNLWAISCEVCEREMPLFSAAEQQHNDIAFIYVNQREPLDIVRRFIQSKAQVPSHVVIDGGGEIAETKGIYSFPVTLFYDAEGQLLYSHDGKISAEVLEAAITQYLK